MPSLQSLKNRIKSIKSTQKITKAMKVVSTSKLKRAREKSEAAVHYADKMQDILLAASSLACEEFEEISLLKNEHEEKVRLMIVVTADRGLCGAFNISIIKAVRKSIDDLIAQGKDIKIICIGKKGYELLKKNYGKYIIAHKDGIGSKGVKYSEACDIAERALSLIHDNQVDSCHIYYNRFKSVIAQVPTQQQLIPLLKEDLKEVDAKIAEQFEFEPDKEKILMDLLPKNLKVQIYKALLESFAGEHASRMTAMDNATRNSGEMIKKLQLVYNRTRQAYITKELIEIISGAEAI